MRLLAPVDQQAHGNAVVTPSQRILIRFHPVVRPWNAGLFSAFSVLAPQAAPRLQSVPATLVWVYSCVKSKPVLKTGVPLRVPRVRIPVSPLRQNASKCSVFPRNPEFTRGFFAFMDLGFAPCPWPCPRVPGVQKGENCDNTRKTEWHQYGHLGTTDGTVFRAVLEKHWLGKPVLGGPGWCGWVLLGFLWQPVELTEI